MGKLVTLTDGNYGPRVTSLALAENIGTTYKATNNLITKHKNRLETLGELPFEKDASSQKIPALLNEDQAIFLLTLSRNTERVVEFKLALTKAFANLRRKQAIIDANQAKAEWQQNRELGKLIRHDITDTIQQFVEYAKAQGSKGAHHYYSNISKGVNKALGIDDRDSIGEQDLHLLATAELIVERVLQAGMRDQLPYKSVYRGLTRVLGDFVLMTHDVDAAALQDGADDG